jgi:two-component system chemotaxis response regulator CheB/chemosensory pili system protein ChpB (putative protein-glutamate methylesterase)
MIVASEHSNTAIALLTGAWESGVSLREALRALGVPIVYEAPIAALDRVALEHSQANVVVLNLDTRDGPGSNAVYDLLDDPHYRVIINDGDVSGRLAGWDRARWQRHLASKVLGVADVDPPRPPATEPASVPPPSRPAAIVAEVADDRRMPEASTAGSMENMPDERSQSSLRAKPDAAKPQATAPSDPVETPAKTKRAETGIEKISVAKIPTPGRAAESPPIVADAGATLELIPLEKATTPNKVQHTERETAFDPAAPAKVKRIWVLGASIGGPEAVREFLSGLPHDYPALFLLAQHLGDEFVDMMTHQLAQVTKMTVRTPAHGERVGHGDIVVVPPGKRLRVDAQGVVTLERIAEKTTYRPSIDRVLRDVADRFGANAGAIVFSGMGEDAIEGCKYLAEKGGVVYVQDPDSCVIGTMVKGVRAAGVASFVGSPRKLAEKLLT